MKSSIVVNDITQYRQLLVVACKHTVFIGEMTVHRGLVRNTNIQGNWWLVTL